MNNRLTGWLSWVLPLIALVFAASACAGAETPLPSPAPFTTPLPTATSILLTPSPTAIPEATVTPSPSPTLTSTRDYPGLITYVHTGQTGMDIYVVRPDGTEPTLVVQGQPVANLPQWLPDGRHIAYFTLGADFSGDLWLVDVVSGSGHQRITRHGDWLATDLSWSPDGAAAVFDVTEEGIPHDLYRLDLSTGEVVDLTAASPGWEGQPAWSPDGEWIAYFSGGETGQMFDIWRIRPDGSRAEQLTNNALDWDDVIPSWSPDYRQIAFYRYARQAGPGAAGGPQGLWVMNAEGVDQRLVAELTEMAEFEPPAWSPDGRYLAFSRRAAGDVSQIWVAPVGGGDPVKVSSLSGVSHGISWSPDSQALTFTAETNETHSQYVAAADGSDTYRLAPEGVSAGFGQWSPVATITAVAAPVAPLGSATPEAGFGGLLAYSCPSADGMEICTVWPDGTARKQVTQEGGQALNPRWSPDGRLIVYEHYDPGTEMPDLRAVEPGTENRARALTTGGMPELRGWLLAPDGSALAFAQPPPDGIEMDVYRLDVSTGQVTNLTADYALWDAWPAWSPDGEWIAFVSERTGPGADSADQLDDICIMRPDGSEVRKLTENGMDWEDWHPRWSPDGQQIAFLRLGYDIAGILEPEGGPAGLWVMDADGRNQRLLTELESGPPLWSPDGKWIAFVAGGDETEGADVWVVPSAGGEPTNISRLPGDESHVSWSPDSRALAVTVERDGIYEQWILSADGQVRYQLTRPGKGALGDFSPTGVDG